MTWAKITWKVHVDGNMRKKPKQDRRDKLI